MSDSDDQAEILHRAYALTFGTPAGQRVFADLELFCKLLEPTSVNGDRERSLLNEGRREVALRIVKFAKLTTSDVLKMHLGGQAPLVTTEGERING